MSIEIIPDKSCPHIESGEAERVGGVHFATAEPPISIELCQLCLDLALSTLENPIPINTDAKNMLDEILDAEYVSGGTDE